MPPDVVADMQARRAKKLRATSPDGKVFECRRCWYLATSPQRHFVILRIECPDGADNFREVPDGG